VKKNKLHLKMTQTRGMSFPYQVQAVNSTL